GGTDAADLFEPFNGTLPRMDYLGRGGDDTFRYAGIDPTLQDGGADDDYFEHGANTTVKGGAGDDVISLLVLPASKDGGTGTHKLSETGNEATDVMDLNTFKSIEITVGATVIGDANDDMHTCLSFFGGDG